MSALLLADRVCELDGRSARSSARCPQSAPRTAAPRAPRSPSPAASRCRRPRTTCRSDLVEGQLGELGDEIAEVGLQVGRGQSQPPVVWAGGREPARRPHVRERARRPRRTRMRAGRRRVGTTQPRRSARRRPTAWRGAANPRRGPGRAGPRPGRPRSGCCRGAAPVGSRPPPPRRRPAARPARRAGADPRQLAVQQVSDSSAPSGKERPRWAARSPRYAAHPLGRPCPR